MIVFIQAIILLSIIIPSLSSSYNKDKYTDNNNLLANNPSQDPSIHLKLLDIKDDFSKYLTKFHSQSCLMEVLATISDECDKLTDDSISKIAYDLTICSFNKIGKRIPLCHPKTHHNHNNCLREFEGDIWTTYSTYLQHITSLCLFYKTVIWEKSSEFLFMKLANSSLGILTDLQSSMQLAQNMISFQEKMSSDLNANISEAIDKIGNVNKLFDNYTEIELRIKEELREIEGKLKSNVIINKIGDLLDDRGGMMNTLTFFVIYFGVLIIVSIVFDQKGKMVLVGICCIGCEVYIVNPRLSSNKSDMNGIEVIYMKMVVLALRGLYYVIAGVVVVIGVCYKGKGKGEGGKGRRNEEITFSQVKSVLGMTPMWVRKYFSRVENQNDTLAEDFKKMVKTMRLQGQGQCKEK